MIPLPPGAMEPVLWPEPFDDPAWAFQIKWDGMRLLTATGPSLRAFNRHGLDRTGWFPELAELPPALDAAEALVDGEAVALLQGRPSFRRLMQRVRSREPARLAGEIAVTYVVFDLLALDGRGLRSLRWEERQALLRERLQPAGPIALVDTVPAEGRMLFDVARRHDLEGIVAKRRDSPYVAGKSGLWRKVKCVKRRPFVIVGYRWREGRLGSLLLAAHDEAGRLFYVGNAVTGLDEATLQALRQVLDENRAEPPPPLLDRPRAPGGSRDVWVWPALTVLVEFLEWTEDLKLRAPVIRALNPTTPEACRLD
ncbi:MAG: DNA ligase [Bacillota bacterium]